MGLQKYSSCWLSICIEQIYIYIYYTYTKYLQPRMYLAKKKYFTNLGFPWNKGISLTKRCRLGLSVVFEVAIIWPDVWLIFYGKCSIGKYSSHMDPMGIYVYIYINIIYIYILSTSKYLQPRMYLMVSSSTSIKKKTKPPHPNIRTASSTRIGPNWASSPWGLGYRSVGGIGLGGGAGGGSTKLRLFATFRNFWGLHYSLVFQKKHPNILGSSLLARRKGRSFGGLNRGGSIRESSRWVQPHPRMNESMYVYFPIETHGEFSYWTWLCFGEFSMGGFSTPPWRL